MIIRKKKLAELIAKEKAEQDREFNRIMQERDEREWRNREINRLDNRINELERMVRSIDKKVNPDKYKEMNHAVIATVEGEF